jgi:thiamine kinase-like enzyme
MNSLNKILIIENDETWRRNFIELIKEVDSSWEFIDCDLSALEKMVDTKLDFNQISYCFIDLELSGATTLDGYDVWGKDRVLPLLKQNAPWIPTACISRYISGTPKIVGELSVADFDGLYPKEIITNEKQTRTNLSWNKNYWKNLLEDLSIKRNAWLTGKSVIETKNKIKSKKEIQIDIDPRLIDVIRDNIGIHDFEESIALLGFCEKKANITITQISEGFSGEYTAKLTCIEENSNKSYWLLKWGAKINKLHAEIKAHHKVFLHGIDRSIFVNSIYSNIVYWKNFAYIAYNFELEAKSGFEVLSKKGITDFSSMIADIVKKFYKNYQTASVFLITEANKWFNDVAFISDLAQKFNLKDMEITNSIIHGDLHLKNILMNDKSPVLIDFAKTTTGPISIDFAKLVMDILVFWEGIDLDNVDLKWEFLKSSALKPLIDVFGNILKQDDDIVFFNFVLIAYAKTYLTYDDVAESVKEKLRRKIA